MLKVLSVILLKLDQKKNKLFIKFCSVDEEGQNMTIAKIINFITNLLIMNFTEHS